MSARVEKLAREQAAIYPDLWDDVEFERFVALEEMPAVLEECAHDLGATTVVFGVDGSISTTSGPIGGFEIAVLDACSLSYPPDYQKLQIQTDAQLDYSYNYATTFLVPCIRAAGYTIGQTVTREEYGAAALELQLWSPYSSINFASDRRWSNYPFNSPELALGLEQLHERCPPYAAGMVRPY